MTFSDSNSCFDGERERAKQEISNALGSMPKKSGWEKISKFILKQNNLFRESLYTINKALYVELEHMTKEAFINTKIKKRTKINVRAKDSLSNVYPQNTPCQKNVVNFFADTPSRKVVKFKQPMTGRTVISNSNKQFCGLLENYREQIASSSHTEISIKEDDEPQEIVNKINTSERFQDQEKSVTFSHQQTKNFNSGHKEKNKFSKFKMPVLQNFEWRESNKDIHKSK